MRIVRVITIELVTVWSHTWSSPMVVRTGTVRTLCRGAFWTGVVGDPCEGIGDGGG